MKKPLVVGVVVLIVSILLLLCMCDDEATSYYLDKNGNGREDFGEGVWYEDKNGTHFYD